MKTKQGKLRNHIAIALAKRSSSGAGGSHGKSKKATRRLDQVALKKEINIGKHD